MRKTEKRSERGVPGSARSGGMVLAAATAVLVFAAPARPAEAASMSHRLQEHLIEGYFLGSLGYGGMEQMDEVVPGLLRAQLGVGVMFPGAGCGGLGAWGMELAAGPVLPLNPAVDFDVQLQPSLLFELPMSNLQFTLRLGALLQADTSNHGVSLGFLAGWYMRPMSFRIGLGFEGYGDGTAMTGLRFELLWLGHDPFPG